jgi:hypothetical protein
VGADTEETVEETVEVTPEQFAMFKAEVLKWWERFGLDLTHEILVGLGYTKPDCCAHCVRYFSARKAVIRLNDKLPVEYATDEQLRSTALHEVVHAVTGDLGVLSGDRFITEEQLDAAEHELVNRIMWLARKAFPE